MCNINVCSYHNECWLSEYCIMHVHCSNVRGKRSLRICPRIWSSLQIEVAKSANSFGTMPFMSTMRFASRRFVCTAVQMLRSINILANNGVLPCDYSTAQTLSRELQIVHSKAGRQYMYSIGLCMYGLVSRNVVHAFLSNKLSQLHKPMLTKPNASYCKHRKKYDNTVMM